MSEKLYARPEGLCFVRTLELALSVCLDRESKCCLCDGGWGGVGVSVRVFVISDNLSLLKFSTYSLYSL